uniref:Uncharacterized protein n=1 Tax=Rhizophora mucronata TaxID=61149 RepID=A0A2P2QR32_RHIMU
MQLKGMLSKQINFKKHYLS